MAEAIEGFAASNVVLFEEYVRGWYDPERVEAILAAWRGPKVEPSAVAKVDTSPVEAMYNALKVIAEDGNISDWLRRYDPMAMRQVFEAVKGYEESAETHVWVEAPIDEWDHCEDDGSGWCTLHDSRIVSKSDKPPYDVCEDRDVVLARQEADRINMDPDLLEAFNELAVVEARLEANGGRGVEDAERIDELRRKLYPDTEGEGYFA